MEVDKESLKLRYSKRADNELLDLYSTGELAEVAYDAIESILAERGLQVPERQTIQHQENHNPGLAVKLLSYWNGNAPLFKAFWFVGFLGGIVAKVLMKLAATLAVPPLVTLILYCVYLLFSSVSIWRCSWNTGRKLWGYVARLYLVLVLSSFSYFFVIGFVEGI